MEVGKVCNDEIINLANMSFDKKEIILAIMYDLSLSDILHLNEKRFARYFNILGYHCSFLKGQLEWTEEQKVHISPKKEGLL